MQKIKITSKLLTGNFLIQLYFSESISLLCFRWGVIVLGSYLYHQVIKYLEEKPPANQTLLDGIYIQLFKYIILEGWMIGVNLSTKDIFGNVPWIVAVIIGWGAYFTRNLFGIHLFVCLVVEYVLIFKPEISEEVEDKKILKWSW